MLMKTDEDIKAFVEDHYYCDAAEDGIRPLWEPFENWPIEDVEEQIELDITALKIFLGECYDNRKRHTT